jgi:hypothetical protein
MARWKWKGVVARNVLRCEEDGEVRGECEARVDSDTSPPCKTAYEPLASARIRSGDVGGGMQLSLYSSGVNSRATK